ncbi:MAG: aminodeoxychorismate synthase component I [Candidatus Sumerlaeota bacterium]|nr:aminodeoxychorismate synthase component I [Candidatus Sumerlaeota bacterium]
MDKASAIFPEQTVLLRWRNSSEKSGWLCFIKPIQVIQTHDIERIEDCLRRVEDALAQGLHAAGFIAYEAAPAFDRALSAHPPGPLPLLWFGLYEAPQWLESLPIPAGATCQTAAWTNAISKEKYLEALRKIRNYIANGHTYQVNFTTRLRADFHGDAYAFFHALYQAQPTPYAAYLDLGDHAICSGSPELFFDLSGAEIFSRPMKGTGTRGLTTQEDELRAAALRASPKERAENTMIVDMIRNDLGRIAHAGSVRVTDMFTVERYATVLQMTSTARAETGASLTKILRAMFPCASVTGAPKVRTMQIIKELETAPRGIYTGCIGCATPGRRARFNVAIRTVHINRATGAAEYGTGGGIVWDSQAEREYEECAAKALLLMRARPSFQLIETLLFKPSGYSLLREHLDRLMDSAHYFGFDVDRESVSTRLCEATERLPRTRHRVRLLASENGDISIEASPLVRSRPRKRWRVALANAPINSQDPFLYHKTTHRQVYEAAKADFPGYDDVILWNERGEVTESTIANVVAKIGGKIVTPPVACGLLPGTLRRHLLARGRLEERVIAREELKRAQAIFLINSVRGWIPISLSP